MVRRCLAPWSAPHLRRGAHARARRATYHPIRTMPPPLAAKTIGRMSEATYQTVRLRRGAHASPAQGACVVELASMLAGEPFNDHPRSVCRVIAGVLRVYNHPLPHPQLGELRPPPPVVFRSASRSS